MKALSIRQPWAWLIIRPDLTDHAARAAAFAAGDIKDIENRTWWRDFHGRILVHAAKGMTRDEYDDVAGFLSEHRPRIQLPAYEAIERGGFIGSVEVNGCVSASKSPWFFGPNGFVLSDPRPLPFTPWRGELGFFHVDQNAFADALAKPAGSLL